MAHDHNHQHNHGHHHDPHQHHHEPPKGWRPHKDWRFWAVILMIVALAGYVLSQDLSWLPWGPWKGQTPAMP